MSKDAIERVKAAEQAAQSGRRELVSRQKAELDAEHSASAERREKANRDAEAYLRVRAKSADEKAEKYLADDRENTQKLVKKLIDGAEANTEKAVQAVIKGII